LLDNLEAQKVAIGTPELDTNTTPLAAALKRLRTVRRDR
jgi:hypothetical protein